MGFFDKLKSVAIKAKCGVGIHAGEYKKIAEETCKYEKTCTDCGKHITKEKHDYDDARYKHPHKCIKVERCLDCGHEKEFESHEGFEEMAVDDYCNVKLRCTRCGYQKVSGKKHDWWVDETTETHRIYKCMRCGGKKSEEKVNFKDK